MEMNFRPYFHFKWIPEREREREREREEEEDPSSSPVRRSPANPELQSVLIALTSRSRELVWRSHCTARSHELQSDDRTAPLDLASSSPTIASLHSHRNHRTFDLAFDPLIFDPPISLSLSLCDFDFCCCGGGVLVVVAFDCRSLLSWVELPCEKICRKIAFSTI